MGQPKALLSMDGWSLLQKNIESLSRVCQEVYVVTGAHTHRIRAAHIRGAEWVVADNWHQGMRASLRAALRSMPPGHVLLTHVDRPTISKETLLALTQGPIIRPRVPVFRGQHGHPVLLPQWLRLRLGEADAKPLRNILREAYVEGVMSEDSRSILNLNRREHWARHRAHARKEVPDLLHR
jgi:CTP:molybdopterin cytidylyltransferase MocA